MVEVRCNRQVEDGDLKVSTFKARDSVDMLHIALSALLVCNEIG